MFPPFPLSGLALPGQDRLWQPTESLVNNTSFLGLAAWLRYPYIQDLLTTVGPVSWVTLTEVGISQGFTLPIVYNV